MPFGMETTIQCVQVQGTLYVGGGITKSGDNSYIVMAYDISGGKWTTLPPYSTRYFAMTVIDNNLVLVGGKVDAYSCSKVLGVWSEVSKKWTHPYPDMTLQRYLCSAFTYKSWLVVAGGTGAGGMKIPSVEVMNTATKQWYAGPPTPIPWAEMKTTIVDDVCYFMGGSSVHAKKVYSVSLPALVSQLNSDSSAKDTQTWKEIPQLPVKGAAPLSISGSLLAVGGEGNPTDMRALHLYQPDSGQWVKVADMPTPRCRCTCIMTTDKELFVAGGFYYGYPATMYTCSTDMLTSYCSLFLTVPIAPSMQE